MCIREVQIFTCPAEEGGYREHVIKQNNLCASREPCKPEMWECRRARFRSACPSCCGRSYVLPGDEPRPRATLTNPWGAIETEEPWCAAFPHDEPGSWSATVAWADNYVEDWAKIMEVIVQVHATWPANPTRDEFVKTDYSLWRESCCSEHRHWMKFCRCDANLSPTKRFLYNPAAALRFFAVEATITRWEEMKVDVNEMDWFIKDVGDLARSERQQRAASFRFCRDGRSRQPLMTAESEKIRREALEEAFATEVATFIQDVQKRYPDPHPFIATAIRREWVLKGMGLMMMYDVGVSDQRMGLVLHRLAMGLRLVRTPASPSDLSSRDLLGGRLSEEREHQLLRDLFRRTITWQGEQVRAYVAKQEQYFDFTRSFPGKLEPVTGPLLKRWIALERPGVTSQCNLCFVDYFQPPNPGQPRNRRGSDATTERSLNEDRNPDHRHNAWTFFEDLSTVEQGEMPVKIRDCPHVFGSACLFRYWGNGHLAGQESRCPLCKALVR